jgi:hypothetical protein
MSGGYIILVRAPDAADGEHARAIWFAHVRDMDQAVHAVAASDQVAQGSEVAVLGTVRHAVLVDHLGVTEGDVKRFDG